MSLNQGASTDSIWLTADCGVRESGVVQYTIMISELKFPEIVAAGVAAARSADTDSVSP